jgi:hypothetical protein
MRWILLLYICAGAALAQGTTPKANASEYPVHAEMRGVAIGAEFMIHSFSRGEETFIARDYLVLEVALFPPKKGTVDVDHGRFRLRINGRKEALAAQPASMVGASLQHPEWSQEPHAIGQVGPVILGAPRQGSPFPGAGGGAPPPRPVPRPESQEGVDKRLPTDAAQLAVETELPQGVFDGPVSGFLYFAYRGKVKGIRSVELLYEDEALKLR